MQGQSLVALVVQHGSSGSEQLVRSVVRPGAGPVGVDVLRGAGIAHRRRRRSDLVVVDRVVAGAGG